MTSGHDSGEPTDRTVKHAEFLSQKCQNKRYKNNNNNNKNNNNNNNNSDYLTSLLIHKSLKGAGRSSCTSRNIALSQ